MKGRKPRTAPRAPTAKTNSMLFPTMAAAPARRVEGTRGDRSGQAVQSVHQVEGVDHREEPENSQGDGQEPQVNGGKARQVKDLEMKTEKGESQGENQLPHQFVAGPQVADVVPKPDQAHPQGGGEDDEGLRQAVKGE